MFRNSVSQRLLPQRHRVCVTTLPNLASKHFVYQPHQISYLKQLLRHIEQSGWHFQFSMSPKQNHQKNTPKDHIWSNWTLFVYKEAFSILPSWLLTWKSWGFLISRQQPRYSARAEGSEHLQSTNRAHSCQSIILNVLRNVNSCWVLSRCLLLFVCIVHRLYINYYIKLFWSGQKEGSEHP